MSYPIGRKCGALQSADFRFVVYLYKAPSLALSVNCVSKKESLREYVLYGVISYLVGLGPKLWRQRDVPPLTILIHFMKERGMKLMNRSPQLLASTAIYLSVPFSP